MLVTNRVYRSEDRGAPHFISAYLEISMLLLLYTQNILES